MVRTIPRRARTCASAPPSSPAPRMATSIMRVGYCNGAMKKELQGQAALVTGGSRGIGFGIAQALVTRGLNVAITGRDESSLADARRRLEGIGAGRVESYPVDVRDHDAIARTVSATVAAFGGLDVVVNNAGIGSFVLVAEMTPAQWAEVIDTNVTGVFNVCNAALPALRQRGGGYII